MSNERATNNQDPPVGAKALAVGPCEDPIRGVYIDTAGDLQVTMKSGDQVTWANLNAGQVYPMRIISVDNLGTCTGLLLW